MEQEHLWDSVRLALADVDAAREAREDVLDIAAAELALMRVVDRGTRAGAVTIEVAGDPIHGQVVTWGEDIVVLDRGTDQVAVRWSGADAIRDLPRALRTELVRPPSWRSVLDGWTGQRVEVRTRGGRYHGELLTAADHLELSGSVVIPWASVLTVRGMAPR